MKFVDRFLQNWRIRKALPFIANQSRVLDIGCGDGALFRVLGDRISFGIGIDGDSKIEVKKSDRIQIISGEFPSALPQEILKAPSDQLCFDVIVLLAVMEHIPRESQKKLAVDCARYLKKGGLVVLTVPEPEVSTILNWLLWFKIIDGMSLEQHFGFEPLETLEIFRPEFKLLQAKKFQLGLNNLFVFQKSD